MISLKQTIRFFHVFVCFICFAKSVAPTCDCPTLEVVKHSKVQAAAAFIAYNYRLYGNARQCYPGTLHQWFRKATVVYDTVSDNYRYALQVLSGGRGGGYPLPELPGLPGKYKQITLRTIVLSVCMSNRPFRCVPE